MEQNVLWTYLVAGAYALILVADVARLLPRLRLSGLSRDTRWALYITLAGSLAGVAGVLWVTANCSVSGRLNSGQTIILAAALTPLLSGHVWSIRILLERRDELH